MLVVQNHNLPFLPIVVANVKQYFVNKLSRMHISIVQGIKLFPKIIRDIGILRSQIKIKAWHQILHHTHTPRSCACLERTH